MGLGLTGKLGRAWVGAWGGAWVVHGWWGWDTFMCLLPGLVRLDFSIGGCLDGDHEEVDGVVSCGMEII